MKTTAAPLDAAVAFCHDVTRADCSYRNSTGLTRLHADRRLLCPCPLETWTNVEPSPAASRFGDPEALRPVQAGHDQPLPVAWGRACLADTQGIRSAPLPR